VSNPTLLNSILNQNTLEDTSLSIDSYKTSALQFVYDH